MKLEPEIVKKGWGQEVIFANSELYCGKILSFRKGSKFSMHFHMLKDETWYINEGEIRITWIYTPTADKYSARFKKGDVWRNKPGELHQVEALEDTTIFEVSTQHFDDDSYRVEKGDSQK